MAEINSKRRRLEKDQGLPMESRKRLCALFSQGRLVRPLQEKAQSFADLAHALALCCGVAPSHAVRKAHAEKLASEIGGTQRKHIITFLCDGMGTSVLDQCLDSSSFLRKHNDPNRLVAVFPATTPAALTTLATGSWPGQHGAPGWELRDQKGCEFHDDSRQPVQIQVLNSRIVDVRTHRPVAELGWDNLDDVFVVPPWVTVGELSRKVKFISAYQCSDFTNWYQGSYAQSGGSIEDTAYDTLGKPEGSEQALRFFDAAIDQVHQSVQEAEREGWNTYIYVYFAHPDKHMHALGTRHPEVYNVVRGIDSRLAGLWDKLKNLDASLVVTADHGHITVDPPEMISIPDALLDCLEYANVGVLGKGRHGYFHCRSGRSDEFERLWAEHPVLRDNFLLLSIDDAAEEGLFGPDPPVPQVRPRLGDFVSVSLGAQTLVTPKEAKSIRDCSNPTCRGAHGSLSPEEMRIPFVLLTPTVSAS
eukprot:TRINITY_DN22102_c0_g1_i1.p1 TRINITY_DN22102_c0_g1~~TRINITY_DN22102_c0_g1_i1.p1  ORF type:complete len:475 (-),score=38.88 TRINITY_DN22102_c0_g1_i1:235-1659(-)